MSVEIKPTGNSNNDGTDSPEADPRIGYRKVSGYPYVRARPGEPKITAEEVQQMLEDFP